MTDKEVLKTGTTTVGILCKDGVVLAADKRATAGYLIANKKFEKVMPITENIAVTVAGTVSDVQLLVKYLKAELKLKKFKTGTNPTVKEAANLLAMFLYSNIRKFSIIPGIAHFIMAGKDDVGYHLYDLAPDGSIAEIDDYVTSGSGSVYSMGVLEIMFKKDMSVNEAVHLSAKCITASIRRDIASGNGIDIVSITKDGVTKVASQSFDPTIEI